jgi:hypothetical protein
VSSPAHTFVSRSLARDQAVAMLDAVRNAAPGRADHLARDPLAVLGSLPEVEVRSVSESQADVGCSVAGAYLEQEEPPVLAVAASLSVGRRGFTVLHEYGHHLQRTVGSLADRLFEHPDQGIALEDAACDAFAAMVLLPDELVMAHIGAGGPEADDVVELWRASSASRSAACVSAADALPAPGHILLVDPLGSLVFAASQRLPPLRRGSHQGHTEVIRQALSSPRHRGKGKTRLAYRDGILGAELHAQAADMDGYLVVVAVTDKAPWEEFTLPSRDLGPTGRSWICEACGHEFSSFAPGCANCRAPHCPECSRCSCPSRVAQRRCENCFLTLPIAMFDGDSKRCIDCS